MMYCLVIHRSRDIHQISVRWYYQTGNNQNTDYKCCVGFYPALHLQDDQICDSETKVSDSRLALLIETNVWQVKHDNRIDPQEAPISLLFRKFVWVIARFVVIFGINTTSDISKLLYVISRAFRRVKFETILKYHEWYLCQMSRTNHAIICLHYHPQKVCNFHM